ncbi:MAG: DUF3794 domain-containing protein [Clostridia bacterium]|nr:DUF3794 domain-containing protein [Clostridia bacterium]
MLLETEKESVCINQIVGQKKDEIIVEGDVIVNDVKPDVLNIISTNGIPCVYKKEVMDGKVRVDGSINTYIIYLADDEDGSVRSLSTVLDFTKVIDIENCTSQMTANVCVKLKKIESKVLNGRKISIKVILEIETKLYSDDNIDIILNVNNLDDIQVLNNQKSINSLIGSGETKVYAKDTISIDAADELAEIMKANIRIIDKDIKLSYNKVLAKADADLSIIYLTEDNRIKNINTRIPIMGFVDIENINDESICDIDYQIKNLIIKPNNADMHSIYIEMEVEISCSAYETKDINLIEDLYSISSDLDFTQMEIKTMSEKQNLREVCNIREQINIPEIDNNKLYNVQTVADILNTTVKNGKIIYEGEVKLELLYETNNSVACRNIEIPFNFEIVSEDINENCVTNTQIDVRRDDFVVNNGNIDTNIELEFGITISRSSKLNIINEISLQDTRDNNIYSMVIYFVKPDDTLWKIAKKFRSTISDITRVNGIEDENKIYVGQQLYIPKFVNRNVAV